MIELLDHMVDLCLVVCRYGPIVEFIGGNMAKILCKCGSVISNVYSPSDVIIHAYTDLEWDSIISNDIIETIRIPKPCFVVWKCSNCNRLYVFRRGEKRPCVIYAPEITDLSS